MWSELRLALSSPEEQLSEALRRWNANDEEGAIKWARRAARRNDLAKVVASQWLMLRRRGTPEEAEAIALVTQAAQAGLTEAQQVLASYYFHGEGVPRDVRAAYEWTRKAADAGNLTCQLTMVEFLSTGEHWEPDIELARHYAELAAAAGHSEPLAALVQQYGQELKK